MKRVARLLLLLTLSYALTRLSACRSNPFDEIPERLILTTRTFEDVVRWRELEKMYAFMKHEEGKENPVQQGLSNVRVTGYELVEELTEVAPMRWRQSAMIDYVLTDRQIVRKLIDHQVWESDDEGKSWLRTTPVPVFR